MSKTVISVWSVFALLGTLTITTPLQAQTARCSGGPCAHPIVGVTTTYRYRTVQQVNNVNRYRNVTRTSYRDINRTKYRDINRVTYRDIVEPRYVRHIHRVVTVTRIQPVERVHMVTRVHPVVISRVHTQVIPRVHVAVIPRVHTRTVVLNETQHVAETRMLPTRVAITGSSTVMAGTRTHQIASSSNSPRLYDYVQPRSWHNQ
jgi:hypothetical protein